MSTNDITGDAIKSKPQNKNYESNYDLIFKKDIDMFGKKPKDDDSSKKPYKKGKK